MRMNKAILELRRSQIFQMRKKLTASTYGELKALLEKIQQEVNEELGVYPRDILLMLQNMETQQVFEKEDVVELLGVFIKALDETIDEMVFEKWEKDKNGIVDIPSILE